MKLILSHLHYAATTDLATKTSNKQNALEMGVERITVTVFTITYLLSLIMPCLFACLFPPGCHIQQLLTGPLLAVVLLL